MVGERLEQRELLAVTLEASPVILLEDGGAATLTARLSSVQTSEVTVNLGYTGTATRNTDYTAGTQIVIPAGQVSASITLEATADQVNDDDESIVVDISSVTGDTEQGTQTVTLRITETLDSAQLRGVVFFDFDRDGQRGTGEPGVPGVVVRLTGQAGGLTIPLEVMSADDGSYGFVDLPAGTYSVEFVASPALWDGAPHAGGAGGTVSGDSITGITLTNNQIAQNYTFSVPSLKPLFITPQFFTTSRPPLEELYRQMIARGEEIAGHSDLAERVRSGVTATNPSVRSAAGEQQPVVTLSAAPVQMDEDGGTSTITATLSSPLATDVTIALTLAGTATRDQDYSAPQSQIVIPAGQTTGTLVLTATDDSAQEGNETVIVQVSSVTGGARAVSGEQTTVTIVDDEPPPTGPPLVTLNANPVEIAESGGTSTITATLSAAASSDVTIALGLAGTATQETDYQASATQIVIPAGQTTGQITVTAVQDDLDELNETVLVSITSVTGDAQESGQQQVEVRITDDDNSPTVSIAPSTTSLTEDGGTAEITATLSAVSGQPVTVDLTFSGTAQLGSDYQRSGQRITIPAGQLSASVTVTALEDTIDEADETVIVTASAATGASLTGTVTHTLTITDTDLPAIQLTATKMQLDETEDQTIIRAVLPTMVDADVTVVLAFSGTATLTSDYTHSGTEITIPAGELSGEITIDTVSDELNEDDETIVVEVTSVTNAAAPAQQQLTVTIADDDPLPTVTLQASDEAMLEDGDTVTVTATLSAVSGRDVTVELDLSGSATEGADYQLSTASIVIPAGQTSAEATLTAVQDALFEDDETIVVDIMSVNGGAEDDVQQVTVDLLDDDDAPTVTLSSSGEMLAEDGGQVTITAQLSAVSGLPVTIDLGFGGTAAQGTDFAASAQQIVIPPGETSGSITLTATDDDEDEEDETISVEVEAIDGADIDPAAAVDLVIVDNDGSSASPATPLPPDQVDLAFCSPQTWGLRLRRSVCVP